MRQRILQLTGQLADPPENASGLKLPGVLDDDTVKDLIGAAYDSTITTLSQVLDGFNDALLMLRRISQVSKFSTNYKIAPWQVWLVDTDSAMGRSLAKLLRRNRFARPHLAGSGQRLQPDSRRQCQLNKLVLVDAFGQRREWLAAAHSTNMIIADTLPDETGPQAAAAPTFLLPLRYAQAARLVFRWLAADGSGLAEIGQDATTTPVCGLAGTEPR